MLYLDSSALVKLVLPEHESAALASELKSSEAEVSSLLAAIEVPRAVRRVTAEPVAHRRADEVLSAVDLREIDSDVVAHSSAVPAEVHSLDAIHLATALSLGESLTGFVAYDRRLQDAAREADLKVLAPGVTPDADVESEDVGADEGEALAMSDDRPEVRQLLGNIKRERAGLGALLAEASSHWGYEDLVYRFWHQSFKAYSVQAVTDRLAEALRALAPEGHQLNPWFERIVDEGTGWEFEAEHNRRWLAVMRPQLEAFFHARFMVEMAVRYGEQLEEPPAALPSGWAALLHLYGLR